MIPRNETLKPVNKKRRSEWYYFKQNFQLTFLAIPTILFLILFKYVPLYGLVLPFKNYKASLGFLKSPWAGLSNFEFLHNNTQVLVALRNTILYNFAFIFLGLCLAVIIALLLFEMSSRSVKLYQTAMYLPHYISWVVAAYAASAFLDMDNGILNKLLLMFGKESVLWYNNPKYWPPILIIAHLWKTCGSNAVVYYAALMGVDKELYESAMLDGAGKIKQMWYISIPSIKSVIVIMTLLSIGKIFYGDFGLFYNFTFNSSLLYSTTDIIDTYVYRTLVELGDIAVSSSVGFLQSVCGFILVVVTNFITRRIDSDNALF